MRDPELPEDIDARDLASAARNELKTLSKENADRVALHLAAAARFIETDPERAHEHAQAAVRHAGRIGVARETLAVTAYAIGDFSLALRELRTHRRITGREDNIALIVDSERGVGRPEKALEEGHAVDRMTLDVATRVELAIAMSGARLDLDQTELALSELDIPELDPDRAFSWSPGLFAARANVLEDLGREEEAAQWRRRAEIAEDALGLNDVPDADDFMFVDEIEELDLDPAESDEPDPLDQDGTADSSDEDGLAEVVDETAAAQTEEEVTAAVVVEDAPAEPAEDVLVVEEKPKRSRAKKAAPVEDAPAEPAEDVLVVEEKPKRSRAKKASVVEEAPVEDAKVQEASVEEKPKRSRAKKAAPVEDAPAEPADEAPAEEKPKRSRAKKAAPADASAAEPADEAPAVEEKPKRARAKKAAPVEDAPAEPAADTPAVEEKPKRTRAKKAAPAKDAPAAEPTIEDEVTQILIEAGIDDPDEAK
ncbi:hypothetical protein [Microbacterium gilvum]|uniref:hypothetical protein n=1 Tax=Microbacterium gilvum TaxID=1336204 RepID=UPI0031EC9AB4